MNNIRHLTVSETDVGVRLDVWLARQVRELSRSQIQLLIHQGRVRVAGQTVKGSRKTRAGESVAIEIPPPVTVGLQPENIPLEILFEDADLIVVNKPAGLVVHPACGHAAGTLVNALLHHCPDMVIGNKIRPGIVHRLDRDTSGVLVAAKHARALTNLAGQFKRRVVRKEYLGLVWGQPRPPAGRIETLIGRHAADRKRMTATPKKGRPAVTHYRTMETFGAMALLQVRLETGRTHQIRVHLAHIGHPVVGDRQYGRRATADLPVEVKRQMLHAHKLTFRHPVTGRELEFMAPLPADMRSLINALRGAPA